MVQRRRRSGLSTQLVLGGLVVLIGLLLLVHTTGVYDTRFLFDYVPSLFVLLGLYAMVRSDFRNLFGPTVVVAVAAVWQLTALDVVERSDVVQFWPLFVVLFGLSLVVGHFRNGPGTRQAPDANVTGLAVFGGSEQRSTSQEFSAADLTALFGGAEFDLRDAAVADRPAYVNVTALFGGAEIIVPRDWNVQLEVLPIFGGASDERARRVEGHDEGGHDEVDLVVTGFAAFGGVSVED